MGTTTRQSHQRKPALLPMYQHSQEFHLMGYQSSDLCIQVWQTHRECTDLRAAAYWTFMSRHQRIHQGATTLSCVHPEQSHFQDLFTTVQPGRELLLNFKNDVVVLFYWHLHCPCHNVRFKKMNLQKTKTKKPHIRKPQKTPPKPHFIFAIAATHLQPLSLILSKVISLIQFTWILTTASKHHTQRYTEKFGIYHFVPQNFQAVKVHEKKKKKKKKSQAGAAAPSGCWLLAGGGL